MTALSLNRLAALATCAIGLIGIASLDFGCRRKPQQQVVLYVSADDHIAREVIARFQDQTGMSVRVVGDNEVSKTTGLVERLRAEKDRPQADVFWSSEIFLTIALADDGVLDEHLSDATTDWPRQWRDGQRRWYAFAARPRVIVYSPKRVAEGDRPRTWMELTHRRWRGRLVMADPRFGTTGGHFGAMMAYWDREVMPGYFRAWAEGIASNDVRLLSSGNAGVVEAVARGEADVGMTDADDVWAAQARGLDVDLIYPSHALPEAGAATQAVTGAGTLLIPNTVARVKGGPNPEAAKALIDFLLSEEVERLLAESVSHNIPLTPGLAAEYPKYHVPDPLEVDWTRAAAWREEAMRTFLEAIEHVKEMRELAAEIDAARRRAETQPDPEDEDAPDGAGGSAPGDGGA